LLCSGGRATRALDVWVCELDGCGTVCVWQDAIAPSREATGRFVERVRELTPHGQRVMAWLLELNDGELAHGLEHLTVDAFGMFVRGAARALGSMQSRAR
jgi:hypothetical protein